MPQWKKLLGSSSSKDGFSASTKLISVNGCFKTTALEMTNNSSNKNCSYQKGDYTLKLCNGTGLQATSKHFNIFILFKKEHHRSHNINRVCKTITSICSHH